VALEYEVSDKKLSRYVDKLTDYYYSPSIAAVLYVCGNDSIEKLIRKADAEIEKDSDGKVFTCLEETIYKSSSELPFINRQKDIFYLE
jgi:hypothetical protein